MNKYIIAFLASLAISSCASKEDISNLSDQQIRLHDQQQKTIREATETTIMAQKETEKALSKQISINQNEALKKIDEVKSAVFSATTPSREEKFSEIQKELQSISMIAYLIEEVSKINNRITNDERNLDKDSNNSDKTENDNLAELSSLRSELEQLISVRADELVGEINKVGKKVEDLPPSKQIIIEYLRTYADIRGSNISEVNIEEKKRVIDDSTMNEESDPEPNSNM